MSKGRLLLAGVLAGIGIFVWGMISHLALGLGQMGVKELPNEPATLNALQENVPEAGFYIYPSGIAVEKAPKDQRDKLMQEYMEVYKTKPHGILILTPSNGTAYNFPALLCNELLSNILNGLLAAFLLSYAIGSIRSMFGRVLFVATLGFFATVAIDFSYWNWYGFPTKYLISSFLDNTIGSAFAGIVLAFAFRKY
jgi:hypothetical protein